MARREEKEVVPSTSLDSTLTTTKKNKKWKNKRRFSDEQIKLMESMFETESKLEQNAKIQLAKELDLQPRQVAIWFQNRRARWKSKQLERDYKVLKANYDALANQYESIKKEKQMLLMQLQKHNNQQRNPKDEGRPSTLSLDGSSTDGEPEQKPALSFDESDLRMPLCSDDENNHNMYLGETEDANLMSIMDPINPILQSPGNWPAFDTDNDLEQSCSTSQWWEFWP